MQLFECGNLVWSREASHVIAIQGKMYHFLFSRKCNIKAENKGELHSFHQGFWYRGDTRNRGLFLVILAKSGFELLLHFLLTVRNEGGPVPFRSFSALWLEKKSCLRSLHSVIKDARSFAPASVRPSPIFINLLFGFSSLRPVNCLKRARPSLSPQPFDRRTFTAFDTPFPVKALRLIVSEGHSVFYKRARRTVRTNSARTLGLDGGSASDLKEMREFFL